MGNDGFDFRNPQRREQKRFEPPPWETEAFEELQRRQAQHQPAPQERAVAAPEPEAQKPEPVGAPGGAAEAPELDEAQMIQMLAELAEEEPEITSETWRVAIFSALVMGAVGAVLIVWGMTILVGSSVTGTLGVIAGSVVLFFGAVFVGAAWWLTVRTLRQRGVL